MTITSKREPPSIWKDFLDGIAYLLKVIGVLVVIGFTISIAVAIYQSLDSAGYIEHSSTMSVYINGNWMVGEFRNCTMDQYDSWNHKWISADERNINCTTAGYQTQSSHDFPIHFNGKIDRTDKTYIDWKCQRNSASISCDAVD